MPELLDGFEQLTGVSGDQPDQIPKALAANAVNRAFRYGENATRLPFLHIELEYPDDADGRQKALLEGGNIQGATFYNAYPSFSESCLIVSVAGTIFRVRIVGRRGIVTQLFTGNEPVYTHAWFAQGFEWLVIQDGSARPILWNGKDPARRSDATQSEVPVGSVMAFIHGRLAVASADGTNQIAVGDIVYGKNATTTADLLSFTETQYWAEGGAFGVPVYVGDITGMYPMPYLDTGTGQNELVVLGTEGGVSLDLSRPRSQWLDSQLLRISLIGGGCVSSHSLAALNGDLFFRSAEGIRSYRNARAEFQQSWHQSPISADVRRWLSTDSRPLLQYASQAAWNNYLFCTCSPLRAAPNSPFAGWHRFHRGFVVLDAEPESNAARTGAPVWNGLWTGIRPVQFVEGRIADQHRCFAWSYDRDGVNRLYEIAREGFQDVWQGGRKKIVSFFDSATLGNAGSSNFQLKQLHGGDIEVSGLPERVTVGVAVRPDASPCFLDGTTFSAGCDCPSGDCFTATAPAWARRNYAPPQVCVPGTNRPFGKMRHWQIRVRMTGWGKVDRLSCRYDPKPSDRTVACDELDCAPADCCPDAENYAYHVAPEGVNTNVPSITPPADVQVVYTSTQSYTARCGSGELGASVTATASASSTVSQADADARALALATAQARAGLQCESCQAQTLEEFSVNNSSKDLSAYFADGYLTVQNPRPWRLIDVHTLTEYANGIVGTDGTLTVVHAVTAGTDVFDPATKVFTDTSGTDTYVRLDVGCPTSGDPDWPALPVY